MNTVRELNAAIRKLGFTVSKRKAADSWFVLRNGDYIGEHRITVSYTGHTFIGTRNHRAVLGVYGVDYLRACQGPNSAPNLTGDFREVVVKANGVAECRAQARLKWGQVAEWYLNRLGSQC